MNALCMQGCSRVHAKFPPKGQGHRRGGRNSSLTSLFRDHTDSWSSLPRRWPMETAINQEHNHNSQVLEVSRGSESGLGQ